MMGKKKSKEPVMAVIYGLLREDTMLGKGYPFVFNADISDILDLNKPELWEAIAELAFNWLKDEQRLLSSEASFKNRQGTPQYRVSAGYCTDKLLCHATNP